MIYYMTSQIIDPTLLKWFNIIIYSKIGFFYYLSLNLLNLLNQFF